MSKKKRKNSIKSKFKRNFGSILFPSNFWRKLILFDARNSIDWNTNIFVEFQSIEFLASNKFNFRQKFDGNRIDPKFLLNFDFIEFFLFFVDIQVSKKKKLFKKNYYTHKYWAAHKINMESDSNRSSIAGKFVFKWFFF